MASFFTNDCIFEDMAVAAVNRGKEEVKDFANATLAAYPDFAMEAISSFGDGRWLATEWVMTGTHTGDLEGMPPTGKSFSVRGVSISEFYKGKIRRHTDYWNLSSLLQQLRLPGGNLR